MRVLIASLFVLVAAVCFASDTHKPNPKCPMDFVGTGLCGDVEWIDGPHFGRVSHFKLVFWNRDDVQKTPVSPNYEVEIYSYMIMCQGHNHGGPQMNWQEVSDGVFEVRDARFIYMENGYWEVRVDLNERAQLNLVSRANLKINPDAPDCEGGDGHHH